MAERIVSIGFLTPTDLKVLGEGFHRHFPITEDGAFSALLARLDEVDAIAKRQTAAKAEPENSR